jgi:hypothetical protein
VPPFNPIENTRAPASQHCYVFRQKHQTERQHPEAKNWQKGKKTTDNQKQARWNAEPPTRRLAQETHARCDPAREPINQLGQARIIAS